jgi:hypothetical protein
MTRRAIVGGLVVAIAASVAGFPFEPYGAHAWSGFFFIVWGLAVFAAAGLLAVQAGRENNDLAVVGFAAVALYGLGTTLNASLLARGLLEASVGIQPGVWAMLASGLALIGLSGRFAGWVRTAGVAAAACHAVAAVAVLFGAELPHTGAEASAWPSLLVAVSKLLLWATMVGWILDHRRQPDREESFA